MGDMQEAMRGPKLSEEAQRARNEGGAIVNERGELVKTVDEEQERIDANVEATDEAQEGLSDEELYPEYKDEEDRTKFLYLNGQAYSFRQYVGIGDLNLESGRGEVKVRPGDYIVDYGEVRTVMPAGMFETLQGAGDKDGVSKDRGERMKKDAEAREDAMNASILNNKSGPDKWTYPIEPIGIDKLERPGPPGPMGVVGTAQGTPVGAKNPNPQRSTKDMRPPQMVGPESSTLAMDSETRRKMGETKPTEAQTASSGTTGPDSTNLVADPNAEAKPQHVVDREIRERQQKSVAPSAAQNKKERSVEELRAAKARGEKLTGLEEARLFDKKK